MKSKNLQRGCDPSSNLGRRTPNSYLQDDQNELSVLSEVKRTYSLVFEEKIGFFDYLALQGFSYGHLIHLQSYYKKHYEGKSYSSHLELEKYILSQKTGHSSLVKTARSYLNYFEKHEKLPLDIILKYRSILKLKRSQPDVYVPSDSEVLASYHKIKQDKTLDLIFLILATSGIRYVECLDFLKNYDGTRFKMSGRHIAYSVAKTRNTKNINNIYLPLFVYKKLEHIDESYPSLRMQFYRKGSLFSVKYLRKWQYNFLIYNNVPESVADFIQGRASKSISANHYLAKAQQADFWYSKITNKLESVFCNTKISQKSNVDSLHTIKTKKQRFCDYSR